MYINRISKCVKSFGISKYPELKHLGVTVRRISTHSPSLTSPEWISDTSKKE